jgi:hypothetical protein
MHNASNTGRTNKSGRALNDYKQIFGLLAEYTSQPKALYITHQKLICRHTKDVCRQLIANGNLREAQSMLMKGLKSNIGLQNAINLLLWFAKEKLEKI